MAEYYFVHMCMRLLIRYILYITSRIHFLPCPRYMPSPRYGDTLIKYIHVCVQRKVTSVLPPLVCRTTGRYMLCKYLPRQGEVGEDQVLRGVGGRNRGTKRYFMYLPAHM